MDPFTIPAQSRTNITPKRQRTRQACEACKLRKRKCDGRQPCASCVQYEYECSFNTTRKRPPAQKGQSSESNTPQTASTNRDDDLRTEANSGIYFPEILNRELNSTSNAKVQGFGWNLGLRCGYTPSEKTITKILTRSQWDDLFGTYIEKIHCVYGFLDLERVRAESSTRWTRGSTNAYDHVLSGIAALASLFSGRDNSIYSDALADCAKEIIECSGLIKDPTFQDVQAWILRTLYLRLSHPPHAAWMASSNTMHVCEAVGIHREVCHESVSDECRRTTFWIAKLLNTWISNEYGRTRLTIRGETCQTPSSKLQKGPADLLKMFSISAILDPDKDSDAESLENALDETEKLRTDHISLILSQTNLCFALYRRLRLRNPRVQNEIAQKVILAGNRGLAACMEALQSNQPWWHVPNIPFQFTCILLAMDTPESLSQVGQAVLTLRNVVDRFGTAITYKALATVEQFVQLSRLRKEREVAILNNSVTTGQQHSANDVDISGIVMPMSGETSDVAWLDGILWDTPTLDGIDWNELWMEPFNFGQ